jgi:hypothetical protein
MYVLVVFNRASLVSLSGPQSQTSGGDACRTSQNGESAAGRPSVRGCSVRRAVPANLLFRNKLAPYQKTVLTEEQAEEMHDILDFYTAAALLGFEHNDGEGVEHCWAALMPGVSAEMLSGERRPIWQLQKVFPQLLRVFGPP